MDRRTGERRAREAPVAVERRRNHPTERRKADKLPCPKCQDRGSQVLPYHPTARERRREDVLGGHWRRRKCDACGYEYQTVERVALRVPTPAATSSNSIE